MFSVQQILTFFLTLTMELGLTACGAEAVVQPAPRKPCRARIPASEARTFAPLRGAKVMAFLFIETSAPACPAPPGTSRAGGTPAPSAPRSSDAVDRRACHPDHGRVEGQPSPLDGPQKIGYVHLHRQAHDTAQIPRYSSGTLSHQGMG